MSRATRLVPLVLVAALLLAAWATVEVLAGAGVRAEHVRHVPLPRLRAVEATPAGRDVARALVAGTGAPMANVSGRVDALLGVGDDLWVGTFDQGVWRLEGDEVKALVGGSPFVNALGRYRGDVVVATANGAERWLTSGQRRGEIVSGVGVTSLLSRRGRLYLGTSRGLALVDDNGVRFADGELALKDQAVHALGWIGDDVLVGTATGVCRVDQHMRRPPACSTLLFGDAPLGSAWVNGVVSTAAGPLVLTDTGGAVLLDAGLDTVRAWRFADPLLDRFEPGAVAQLGLRAVAVATQGSGVLLLSVDGSTRRWTAGPSDVTALTSPAAGRLIVGTASGEVRSLQL